MQCCLHLDLRAVDALFLSVFPWRDDAIDVRVGAGRSTPLHLPVEIVFALVAEDGDDLALFGKKPPNPNEKQGRATHINIINWWQSGGSMGVKPEGWSEQDIQNYIDRFYLNKSSSKPEAPSDQLESLKFMSVQFEFGSELGIKYLKISP